MSCVCAGEDVGSPRPTVSGSVFLQAEREKGKKSVYRVLHTCNQRVMFCSQACVSVSV